MADISKNQKEILEMLTSEYLTPQQIASRRGISHQAIYKTIAKLKKKGLLKGGLHKTYDLGGLQKPEVVAEGHILRLHNIQISIKILRKTTFYEKLLIRCNKLNWQHVTILLYGDKVEVYTVEGVSFTGHDTKNCYMKAIGFFTFLYAKIENRCKIAIDKEGYLNKKWVRQHIAEVDSEVAKDANARGDPLKFKKLEDGKTWLITDDSFKLKELEFVHPETAKTDTDRVKKQLDDFRKYDPPTNSELATHLKGVMLCLNQEIESQKQIIEAQTVYNANIVKHLGVLDEMSGAMKDIRDLVKQTQPSQLYQKLINSIRSVEDYVLYKGLVNRLPLPEKQQLEQHILKNLINN